MNIEKLKQELTNQGIEAEHVEVVKNGITCRGFRLLIGGNVSPVVYYSADEALESFLIRVNDALEEIPEFDYRLITNKNYVLKNLYISIQRKGAGMDVIKRQILNLEAVLKLRVDFNKTNEIGSVAITEQLLKTVNLAEEIAWETAMGNMAETFLVRSMAEMVGVPEELFPTPFYVLTTESGMDGAAALLFPEIFKEFCMNHNLDSCIILPSSKEELLLLPDSEGISYVELAKMVDEVNRTAVDEMIQLEAEVLIYDTDKNCIGICAEALDDE